MTRADALLAEAAALRARAEAIEAEARRLEAVEHDSAIVEAIGHYRGSLYARASKLEIRLKAYAANGWQRENGLDSLAPGATPERRALHRVLRSRCGETVGWRQICTICNRARVTLQNLQCDSQLE